MTPEEIRKTLPDGIELYKSPCSGRYSFKATAGTIDGHKFRKEFGELKWKGIEKARAAAVLWQAEMKAKIREEGTVLLDIPAKTRRQVITAQEILEPLGISLVEAAEMAANQVRVKQVKEEVTLAQAKEALIRFKKDQNSKPRYITDLEARLGTLCAALGHRKINQITAHDLEAFLKRRSPIKPITWNNYRRVFSVLWNFAAMGRNRWVTENVASQVAFQKVDIEEVTALTVPQVKTLLAVAAENQPRLVPYLCLGMFAGLRPGEAQNANWEDIDWDQKVIRVRSAKVRSNINRYVNLSHVFVDWMDHWQNWLGKLEGPICTGAYAVRNDLAELRKLTFDFGPIIFRHTYGSYHLAAFQNPNETMHEMGHSTLKMLYAHYRKPIPKRTAEGFWDLDRAILPRNSDHFPPDELTPEEQQDRLIEMENRCKTPEQLAALSRIVEMCDQTNKELLAEDEQDDDHGEDWKQTA